jgi:hypothetical protein
MLLEQNGELVILEAMFNNSAIQYVYNLLLVFDILTKEQTLEMPFEVLS